MEEHSNDCINTTKDKSKTGKYGFGQSVPTKLLLQHLGQSHSILVPASI
jgi:hypothetical protein